MPSRFRSFIKPSLFLSLVALAIYALPIPLTRARSSGSPPGFTNAPDENNCAACHSDYALDSGPGSVRIFGVPANYTPSERVPLSVKVKQNSAPILGFQITAIWDSGPNAGMRAGTLTITDAVQTWLRPNLDNTRDYIVQTSDGATPTAAQEKTWSFIWQAPATRQGRISFYATGNGGNLDHSTTGDYIYSTTARTGSAPADFDGDGKTDVSVFRPTTGGWYINRSSLGLAGYAFGASGDLITPGDFDGDNKTDVAVFRPGSGYWYILQSSDGAFRAVPFGANGDQPIAADYDGDGKSDIAVYRGSVGTWYYLQSSDDAFRAVAFGAGGDKVMPQDYDGDGKIDIGVFRPSNGYWYLLRSSDGGFYYSQFGLGSDTPVAGDYDGDAKADFAVFRKSGMNGIWYVLRSSDNNVFGMQFGADTDRPAPGYYDGDGKTDIGVFRQADGNWYTLNSGDGQVQSQHFGASGDLSVPSAYIAQ